MGVIALEGKDKELGDGFLLHAIEEAQLTHPSRIALRSADQNLTYAQLWKLSSELMSGLASEGAMRGDRIAIWAVRSPWTIAMMLATMRLGASFVPIDPTYPDERIRQCLRVANPRLSVREEENARDGASSNQWVVLKPTSPILDPISVSGDVPAYVICTSGTTGLPKGVEVEHRSLWNYCRWVIDEVMDGLTDPPVVPLFASLGFDHAITCIWPVLAVGGTVDIFPNLPAFASALKSRSYSMVKATPSHLRLLMRLGIDDIGDSVECLMFGGEALEVDLVKSLGLQEHEIRILNHYGPTEATVGCCAYFFSPNVSSGLVAVPIGRPIYNSRAYLLEDGKPLELTTGVVGELVVAGTCVARGYVGEEAAENFIQESTLDDSRQDLAYRTGDMVKLMEDGSLLYLGRNDSQVKISGMRVDLSELRLAASSAYGVREALVVKDTATNLPRILAVRVQGALVSGVVNAVKRELKERLPTGVSAQVTVVDMIAVDVHGKVDVAGTLERALDGGSTETHGGGQ